MHGVDMGAQMGVKARRGEGRFSVGVRHLGLCIVRKEQLLLLPACSLPPAPAVSHEARRGCLRPAIEGAAMFHGIITGNSEVSCW